MLCKSDTQCFASRLIRSVSRLKPWSDKYSVETIHACARINDCLDKEQRLQGQGTKIAAAILPSPYISSIHKACTKPTHKSCACHCLFHVGQRQDVRSLVLHISHAEGRLRSRQEVVQILLPLKCVKRQEVCRCQIEERQKLREC